jgi:hypothetical protein
MKRTVAGVLIGILLAAGMAMGGPSFARAETDGFGGMEIVSAEGLDATRGGYKAGTDLMFSFGIEKAVYVNGVLEATSSLNLLQPGGIELSQNPGSSLFRMAREFLRSSCRLPGDNRPEQPGLPEDPDHHED